MNSSEFPPGAVKLQRLGRLVRWEAIVSCRENIKIKVAVSPIGYAGNMYELQDMFNVLLTGPDKLCKIIVWGTYLWVLEGPK